MQLSITLEFEKNAAATRETFAALKQAGFYGLSWTNNWAFQIDFYDKALAEMVAAASAEYSIPITSLHGYSGASEPVTNTWELNLALNVNRLEFMQRIGCPILVIHNPPVSETSLPSAIDSSKRYVEALLKYSRPGKIKIALENLFHPKQYQQIEYFDALFEYFAPEDVGMCLDSGHAIITGYPELVSRYRERIITTHLHDNNADWKKARTSGVSQDERDKHQQPGSGNCDWRAIVTALSDKLTPEMLCLELLWLAKKEPLDIFLPRVKADFEKLWNENRQF